MPGLAHKSGEDRNAPAELAPAQPRPARLGLGPAAPLEVPHPCRRHARLGLPSAAHAAIVAERRPVPARARPSSPPRNGGVPPPRVEPPTASARASCPVRVNLTWFPSQRRPGRAGPSGVAGAAGIILPVSLIRPRSSRPTVPTCCRRTPPLPCVPDLGPSLIPPQRAARAMAATAERGGGCGASVGTHDRASAGAPHRHGAARHSRPRARAEPRDAQILGGRSPSTTTRAAESALHAGQHLRPGANRRQYGGRQRGVRHDRGAYGCGRCRSRPTG